MRRQLKPSAYVRRFAQRIADSARDFPIADIGCGSGRNALALVQVGCPVICIDRDLSRLRKEEFGSAAEKSLRLLLMDVHKDPWPFSAGTLGGIVIVDFLPWLLFPHLTESLVPNGCLLLETVSGRGGNFRELPQALQLETAFRANLVVEDYREKHVGPRTSGAVTVKMLGRRKS